MYPKDLLLMARIKLLILAIVFVSVLHAEVSLPPWDWSTYTGTSQWRTEVVEDDSGCDGGTISDIQSVTVDFNKGHAQLGDWGHGMFSGLIQGNTLNIPGKTIPDGGGTSVLSPFQVVFSSDCLTFTTTYHWDYSDDYQSCSGTTTLTGTNSKGSCPAPTSMPAIPGDNPNVVTPSIETLKAEIRDARTDLNVDLALYRAIGADSIAIKDYERRGKENDDPHQFDSLTAPLYNDITDKQAKASQIEPAIEAKYQVILDKDPNNFWANWDMAELKKNQGKYDDFSKYFDSATTNKNILTDTSDKLKTNAAHDLGIPYIPTVQNSNVVRIIQDDGSNRWTGGMIYNLNVPKEAANDHFWNLKLSTLFSNKIYNLVVGTVGEPKAD